MSESCRAARWPTAWKDPGYRVITVPARRRCVEIARREKPLLVIADLAARRKGICPLIADLRQHAETSHIPVIAIGDASDPRLEATARKAGACWWSRKTPSPSTSSNCWNRHCAWIEGEVDRLWLRVERTISDFRFQISDFRFQISDFRFQIADCGLRIEFKASLTPATNFKGRGKRRNCRLRLKTNPPAVML